MRRINLLQRRFDESGESFADLVSDCRSRLSIIPVYDLAVGNWPVGYVIMYGGQRLGDVTRTESGFIGYINESVTPIPIGPYRRLRQVVERLYLRRELE